MARENKSLPLFHETWAVRVALPLGLWLLMSWFGFAMWMKPGLLGDFRNLLLGLSVLYWVVIAAVAFAAWRRRDRLTGVWRIIVPALFIMFVVWGLAGWLRVGAFWRR